MVYNEQVDTFIETERGNIQRKGSGDILLCPYSPHGMFCGPRCALFRFRQHGEKWAFIQNCVSVNWEEQIERHVNP